MVGRLWNGGITHPVVWKVQKPFFLQLKDLCFTVHTCKLLFSSLIFTKHKAFLVKICFYYNLFVWSFVQQLDSLCLKDSPEKNTKGGFAAYAKRSIENRIKHEQWKIWTSAIQSYSIRNKTRNKNKPSSCRPLGENLIKHNGSCQTN